MASLFQAENVKNVIFNHQTMIFEHDKLKHIKQDGLRTLIITCFMRIVTKT